MKKDGEEERERLGCVIETHVMVLSTEAMDAQMPSHVALDGESATTAFFCADKGLFAGV